MYQLRYQPKDPVAGSVYRSADGVYAEPGNVVEVIGKVARRLLDDHPEDWTLLGSTGEDHSMSAQVPAIAPTTAASLAVQPIETQKAPAEVAETNPAASARKSLDADAAKAKLDEEEVAPPQPPKLPPAPELAPGKRIRAVSETVLNGVKVKVGEEHDLPGDLADALVQTGAWKHSRPERKARRIHAPKFPFKFLAR